MTTITNRPMLDLSVLTRTAAALEAGEALDLAATGLGSREAYMGFVGAWKTAWHALVAGIRKAKRQRKRSSTEFDPRAQDRRQELRVDARRLLHLRLAAKRGARIARDAEAPALAAGQSAADAERSELAKAAAR